MKWDISDIQNWGPSRHNPGAVIPEAGNARYYRTGGWRTDRPVRDAEKCTQCLFCYFFCPDSSILIEDRKVVGFDYDHCKGCGICANQCPADCIEMLPETEFRGLDAAEGGQA